jgi:competence protein ComFC
MWMIQSRIKKFILFFSSVLFPSYCCVCGKEGSPLCEVCLLKRTQALNTPAPWILSIYSFKDPVIKKAIHGIKYFHRKDLITPLTGVITKEILENPLQTERVLIPIPMPKIRTYIRGYNHAEAIAKKIGEQTGLAVRNDILVRHFSKKRQVTTRSRRERIQNQRNAFMVIQDVAGMNIILIDDVTTTGATLLEARKLLLKHGAAHVEAFTIAH